MLLSNHHKALVVADDVTMSAVAVTKDNFLSVTHFDYKCERSRDEIGIPFGSTLSVILNLSIKVATNDSGRIFYERLQMESRFPFTFLFNAVFDENAKLKDYDAGMVVYGYVVDIDETHKSLAPDDGQMRQFVSIRMLVSSITYLGVDSHKSLHIIHNDD